VLHSSAARTNISARDAAPLARHVVEYAGQAGWLLDSGIKVDQRVARRWLLKLANVHRYRPPPSGALPQAHGSQPCREPARSN
jgi:hypothetical protein